MKQKISKKDKILLIRKKLIQKKLSSLGNEREYLEYMCRKRKISTNGSNLELINQFVKSRVPKNKNPQTIQYSYGTYIGDFYENDEIILPNGFGKMKFKNGNVYEGQFYEGFMDGRGTLYNKTGNLVIEAEWFEGQLNGNVCMKYNEKILFDGKYKNGLKNGFGRENINGTYYEGEFKLDKYHGFGILKKKNRYYEGMFKYGKKNGKGILKEFTGKYNKEFKITQGLWKDDKFICDSVWERKKICIQSYLDTHHSRYLKTISSTDIKSYIKSKFSIDENKKIKKDEWVKKLLCLEKKSKTIQNNTIDLEYDIFGYRIQTPCRGNDNQIYDLRSMNYLFDKNENGEFKNIPYEYNNERLVPKYPIMTNGIRLSSFTIL